MPTPNVYPPEEWLQRRWEAHHKYNKAISQAEGLASIVVIQEIYDGPILSPLEHPFKR